MQPDYRCLSAWKALWLARWQCSRFWQVITWTVHFSAAHLLLVHFVWHAYFMDLTVSQITRLSLQNASLTTSGCREHLYLARCLLPLYWQFRNSTGCLKWKLWIWCSLDVYICTHLPVFWLFNCWNGFVWSSDSGKILQYGSRTRSQTDGLSWGALYHRWWQWHYSFFVSCFGQWGICCKTDCL